MAFLSGDIKGMAAPHLFLELSLGRRTGSAVFEKYEEIRKVYWKEGEVVAAASKVDEETLCMVLLRAEIIKREQYDAAAQHAQNKRRPHEAALVELGFITPKDLAWGEKLRALKIIQRIFCLQAGTFRFDEGPQTLPGAAPLQLKFEDAVIKVLRAMDWKNVRKILPPLETVVRVAGRPPSLPAVALSADERTILSLIDGKRSIEKICSLSGSGDFNTLTALYFFLAIRLVETGEAASEQVKTGAREALHEPAQKQPAGKERAEKETQEAQAAPEMATSEMRVVIEQAYADLEGQNHYQVLGVEEQVSTADLKKIYFKLAKLYHPDRHLHPAAADLKVALETLFARITEAYNVLSNQAKRDEYNLSRLMKAKTTAAQEDKTDSAATAANQFNKGLKDFKSGNFWGAHEAFEWACRLDPSNARYWHYQGLALAEMPRRHHDAENNLKKATEMEPMRPEFHVALGNLYLRNNLKAKALSVFREALKWDPDSQTAQQGIMEAEGKKPAGDGSGMFGKIFGGKK